MSLDRLMPLKFFRIAWRLRPELRVAIPPQQAAMFYAIICDAVAAEAEGSPAMPEGVLLAAPDQGQIFASPQRPLTLAASILEHDEAVAARRVHQLHDGLLKLGRRPAKAQRLKKFEVLDPVDLVSGRTLRAGQQPNAVSVAALDKQFADLSTLNSITLRFDAPLTAKRPQAQRREGHAFFDQEYFAASLFMKRLEDRLSALGWQLPTASDESSRLRAEPVDLVWLDVGYRGKKVMTLGGVVGRVRLDNVSARDLLLLVLGQYVHAGENTRFGFGRYVIEELIQETGEHQALVFPRSSSLLTAALTPHNLDVVATESELESGPLRAAVRAIEQGNYQPDPLFHMAISKISGGQRRLSIPSRRDRALQRLVLDELAPAIDAFLESSAIAYRRGLGRQQAPRRVRQAVRDGYRWSVKADFSSFFDNVDIGLLRTRLRAYLPDEDLLRLIDQWLVMDTNQPQSRGLPTGSPLSPVLANLLLDQFDERIAAQGGQLIRYSDDFLILCRDEAQARSMCRIAANEAEQLRLELNQTKTQVAAPGDTFQFVGYRFTLGDQWQVDGDESAVLIEDLGWQKANQHSAPLASRVHLPGEAEQWNDSAASILVVGPNVSRLSADTKSLSIECEGVLKQKIPLADLQSIITLGNTELPWRTVGNLMAAGIPIDLCDEWLRPITTISREAQVAEAVWVERQLNAAASAELRLQVARKLIACKLHNYACLSKSLRGGRDAVVNQLIDASVAAEQSSSIDVLLGIEGAGAAVWYGSFAQWLGRDFTFTHRVAPDATDPINVLLNIAYTLMHRLASLVIQHSGLLPTVGILHVPRALHHALASDLQEPLRHVADRAVIEASRILRASDFKHDPTGPFALSIQPRARATFLELFHRHMQMAVTGHNQHEPAAYRRQFERMTRSWKRCLETNQAADFQPFRHPGGA